MFRVMPVCKIDNVMNKNIEIQVLEIEIWKFLFFFKYFIKICLAIFVSSGIPSLVCGFARNTEIVSFFFHFFGTEKTRVFPKRF